MCLLILRQGGLQQRLRGVIAAGGMTVGMIGIVLRGGLFHAVIEGMIAPKMTAMMMMMMMKNQKRIPETETEAEAGTGIGRGQTSLTATTTRMARLKRNIFQDPGRLTKLFPMCGSETMRMAVITILIVRKQRGCLMMPCETVLRGAPPPSISHLSATRWSNCTQIGTSVALDGNVSATLRCRCKSLELAGSAFRKIVMPMAFW